LGSRITELGRGPSPTAANKAMTPRAELWKPGSPGGSQSRQVWLGATWQGPSMPKDGTGAEAVPGMIGVHWWLLRLVVT
jgi:hypothetical protein